MLQTRWKYDNAISMFCVSRNSDENFYMVFFGYGSIEQYACVILRLSAPYEYV